MPGRARHAEEFECSSDAKIPNRSDLVFEVFLTVGGHLNSVNEMKFIMSYFEIRPPIIFKAEFEHLPSLRTDIKSALCECKLFESKIAFML